LPRYRAGVGAKKTPEKRRGINGRVAAVSPDHLANLETAHEFDLETEAVSPEEMDDVIPLVTTAQEVLDLIEDMKSCRVDEIYIHNVSRDQSAFLKFIASEVMPAIDRT